MCVEGFVVYGAAECANVGLLAHEERVCGVRGDTALTGALGRLADVPANETGASRCKVELAPIVCNPDKGIGDVPTRVADIEAASRGLRTALHLLHLCGATLVHILRNEPRGMARVGHG